MLLSVTVVILKVFLMAIDVRCENAGRRSFKCNLCGAAFSLIGHVKGHMGNQTCKNTFKCDISDSEFSCSGNLKLHLRFPTGERPFSCNIKSKAISHFEQLQFSTSNLKNLNSPKVTDVHEIVHFY